MPVRLLPLLLLLPLPLFADEKPAPPPEPAAGQGIMVGEVTPASAIVQLRLTNGDQLQPAAGQRFTRDLPGVGGVVLFTLFSADGKTELAEQAAGAGPHWDYIARVKFSNLRPGTRYVCKTLLAENNGTLKPGPTAEFKTLPGAGKAEEVKFVVVTGMNYAKFHGDDRINKKEHQEQNNTELPRPYAGPDKQLGYPGLAAILKQQPDFFIGTGDNVYYDTPSDPRAETVTEMRQKWHEQFVQPRYRDLFARVPTYWEVDDHDYRIDDGDNTGDLLPSPETGRQVLLEQLPFGRQGDNSVKTYRTHRVSKDLQIWFTENRMYRSPNKTPDGPEKTIWGQEQKEWLKRTLLESDATFKLLVSPTPMTGPDDRRKTDNHTNVGGFQHERDEFFQWLADNQLLEKHFYIICGDRHWQYHSQFPGGVEEFSCGALVDENSRLGRSPGDPQSTDPEAKIKQLYSQKERSGGFLMVTVTPATGGQPAQARFQFFDEHGAELYQHVKRYTGSAAHPRGSLRARARGTMWARGIVPPADAGGLPVASSRRSGERSLLAHFPLRCRCITLCRWYSQVFTESVDRQTS